MVKVVLVLFIPCILCGTIPKRETFCGLICPTVYDPVCGTDGKTYSNECVLKSAKCGTPSLHLVHRGRCEARLLRIICTTPYCWPTYEPICGSDGITYANGCSFSNAHCYEQDLKKEHLGPCETPSTTTTATTTTLTTTSKNEIVF